jgi:glycosidase
MTGGHDPDNRKDFPGGWPGDTRNAFTKEGRTPDEQEMFEWTQKWLKLRRESLALRQGSIIDLFYDDEVYVFAREHQGFVRVIGVNRSDKAREIAFGPGSLMVRGIHTNDKLPTNFVVSLGAKTVTDYSYQP